MGREDHRPEPTSRAPRVGVTRELSPPFTFKRGCGYSWSHSYLVGSEPWECLPALNVARDLALHMRAMVPLDFFFGPVAVEFPDDPFRRCGEDRNCQGSNLLLSVRGEAPLRAGIVMPFAVWSLSGRYYDTTGATRAGYTRLTILTSGSYPPEPGGYRYPLDYYPEWAEFIPWLAAHPFLFADKYGRKCKPADYVTLTHHAYYQKFGPSDL